MAKLREWARKWREETYAVYLAGRDPRVPWYAKALALAVVGYALSPIDLIPDFIPVVGYLDDLVVVPVGIWLVVRMIPPEVMAECRARSREVMERRPTNWVAGGIFLGIWVGVAVLSGWLLLRLIRGR